MASFVLYFSSITHGQWFVYICAFTSFCVGAKQVSLFLFNRMSSTFRKEKERETKIMREDMLKMEDEIITLTSENKKLEQQKRELQQKVEKLDMQILNLKNR